MKTAYVIRDKESKFFVSQYDSNVGRFWFGKNPGIMRDSQEKINVFLDNEFEDGWLTTDGNNKEVNPSDLEVVEIEWRVKE